MKKLFAFCAGLLAVLNQTAVTALAAEPEAAGAAAQTPLCRTPALHRGSSACESRVVGGAPAARGRVLVPAVPDPVCREVRCAEGGGDDTGMYHKRLPDIHRPSFRIVLCIR